MHSKGDVEALDAFTTVNGNLDQRRKYGITLKEGLEVWNRKFKKAKTAETVAKMKKTVSDFIAFLNVFDVQIADITNRQEHDFNEALQATKAKTTILGNISRLRSIWTY